MLRNPVSRCAIALLLTSLLGLAASVSGVIKDQSGATVTGVTVVLGSIPAAGKPRMVQADASGAFRIADLPAGRYRLHIAQAGFEAFDEDVTAEDGKDSALEIRLKVAEIKQHIEIPGGRRGNVDPVYRSLRDSGLGDAFTVENLVLHRDNGAVTLKTGTLAFTPAVMGRDTEAVFSGEGEFTFDPLLGVERDHLKLLTGEESVRESFDRAFFCFTDATAQEIRSQAKSHGPDARLADVL